MIKQLTRAAAGTAVALLLICDASGITSNLSASKDNTLFESFSGTLSNGAGPGLFIGRTAISGDIRRALIKFDFEDSEVPSSATITSASLTLNVSKFANDSFVDIVELRRVTADWGEAGSNSTLDFDGGGDGATAEVGDATWKHSFSPNTNWINLGGDFSDDVSASQGVSGNGSYVWSSPQLASDIQDMLDNPNGNFGWILIGNESFFETAKRFDSRESDNPPILTIEFDLPGGSGADFDGSGFVDGEDLDDWQDAFGSGTNAADADGDNDSDGADFLVWQRELGSGAGLQTATVPEPSSAVLGLAMLVLGVLNRRGSAVLH